MKLPNAERAVVDIRKLRDSTLRIPTEDLLCSKVQLSGMRRSKAGWLRRAALLKMTHGCDPSAGKSYVQISHGAISRWLSRNGFQTQPSPHHRSTQPTLDLTAPKPGAQRVLASTGSARHWPVGAVSPRPPALPGIPPRTAPGPLQPIAPSCRQMSHAARCIARRDFKRRGPAAR